MAGYDASETREIEVDRVLLAAAIQTLEGPVHEGKATKVIGPDGDAVYRKVPGKS